VRGLSTDGTVEALGANQLINSEARAFAVEPRRALLGLARSWRADTARGARVRVAIAVSLLAVEVFRAQAAVLDVVSLSCSSQVSLLERLTLRLDAVVQVRASDTGDGFDVLTTGAVRSKRALVGVSITEQTSKAFIGTSVATTTGETVIEEFTLDVGVESTSGARCGVQRIEGTVRSFGTLLRLNLIVITIESRETRCAFGDLFATSLERECSNRAKHGGVFSLFAIVSEGAGVSFLV